MLQPKDRAITASVAPLASSPSNWRSRWSSGVSLFFDSARLSGTARSQIASKSPHATSSNEDGWITYATPVQEYLKNTMHGK